MKKFIWPAICVVLLGALVFTSISWDNAVEAGAEKQLVLELAFDTAYAGAHRALNNVTQSLGEIVNSGQYVANRVDNSITFYAHNLRAALGQGNVVEYHANNHTHNFFEGFSRPALDLAGYLLVLDHELANRAGRLPAEALELLATVKSELESLTGLLAEVKTPSSSRVHLSPDRFLITEEEAQRLRTKTTEVNGALEQLLDSLGWQGL